MTRLDHVVTEALSEMAGEVSQSSDEASIIQWSPDGSRYSTATRTSTSIVDADSGAVIRFFATSSMGTFWSADSRSLLAYQGPEETFHPVVVDVRSGAVRSVTLLPGGLFPIGWDTPDRLVWGRFDNQDGPTVLITATLDGTDVRDWLRVDGSHSLDQVQWTTELSR